MLFLIIRSKVLKSVAFLMRSKSYIDNDAYICTSRGSGCSTILLFCTRKCVSFRIFKYDVDIANGLKDYFSYRTQIIFSISISVPNRKC